MTFNVFFYGGIQHHLDFVLGGWQVKDGSMSNATVLDIWLFVHLCSVNRNGSLCVKTALVYSNISKHINSWRENLQVSVFKAVQEVID